MHRPKGPGDGVQWNSETPTGLLVTAGTEALLASHFTWVGMQGPHVHEALWVCVEVSFLQGFCLEVQIRMAARHCSVPRGTRA